jgi:hypothetical protein
MEAIYGIIERKKQGIDCTEAESAEIKGWLRNMKLPFEQPTEADIQQLFPQEFGEFLTEVEIKAKASMVVMSHLSDVQEMMEMGLSKKDANNRINFAKYIISKTNGDLNQEIDVDALWAEFRETRFYRS